MPQLGGHNGWRYGGLVGAGAQAAPLPVNPVCGTLIIGRGDGLGDSELFDGYFLPRLLPLEG